ncbi:MAG: DUF547 domain-containing protein [Proteobacteria bacterium]|nr:DUF547 domain-containing protein [Pseudomonadota bacterium]
MAKPEKPAFYSKITLLLPGLILAASIALCPWEVSARVNNTVYAGLLAQYVTKGRVDYAGFKQDEKRLDDYLAVLAATDSDSLSRNEKFAFYINAYNAFTIKLILTKYPGVNSIKEIGSFFSSPWSKKFISLNGRTVSLDYIEHEVLRPLFKDPRVHFAINCASKSCPPLLDRPYEGNILEAQLDEVTRSFVNDKKFNFLKERTLFVSRIFTWFEEDFNGKPLLFIRQYAEDGFRTKLDAPGPEINLIYLDYDWTLNRP